MQYDVYSFLKRLKVSGLSPQHKRTLRGQAIKGDLKGAEKGFYRLVEAQRKARKEVG